ncbi:MAG: hypothetical protein V1893_01085 [Candidatus Omnitrophota bacterium]
MVVNNLFWFLVVLFWMLAVFKRALDKKNKMIKLKEAEIEWLRLRAEFLGYPEEFQKRPKEQILYYYPHLQKIYATYNETEITEDIKKEAFPHSEYGL